MAIHWLWEPLSAYWARKRLERLRSNAAARLFTEQNEPERVTEDPDAGAWRLLGGVGGKDVDDAERQTVRDKARHLADFNPYARSALSLYRHYVIGTGMKHEVAWAGDPDVVEAAPPATLRRARSLWTDFLAVNDWDTGHRKDWEFCTRTWRDGECFLRLFRQPVWPPRIHFIDPEHIAADPRTGRPASGIETAPGNVEVPVAYSVVVDKDAEVVEAERVLHTKIGVDANVKRGVSLLFPVLDPLKRFQGWLDVELIHRKLASSIVLVRKHSQSYPGGVSAFADSLQTNPTNTIGPRRTTIQPGSIIDTQGYDLSYLSPDSNFADASVLGRMILLAVAAGLGLPEFMLTADASNANYASTLVAEGPAVRQFAAWQAFFAGQWKKLFGMVMDEAVRLGYVSAADRRGLALRLTPPPLAVRNRHDEAQADAIYFDRGALSARELARRDQADPDQMARERAAEVSFPSPPSGERGDLGEDTYGSVRSHTH